MLAGQSQRRVERNIMVGPRLTCLVLLVTTYWGAHSLIVGALRQWKNTAYNYRKEQMVHLLYLYLVHLLSTEGQDSLFVQSRR